MARTAWYLSLSRSWCVSLSLSSLGGTPDSDVAGRSRDGLARRLLLRYVDRRGGRAVDLEVRVRKLSGGLAPVAQQALLGPGSFSLYILFMVSGMAMICIDCSPIFLCR